MSMTCCFPPSPHAWRQTAGAFGLIRDQDVGDAEEGGAGIARPVLLLNILPPLLVLLFAVEILFRTYGWP
jgi:hypothetical protein